MHTRTQLASEMFEVTIAGRAATVADLFPGWSRTDRFGLVIDAPLGASGANLLIQSAISAFYDVQRASGTPAAVYPEIYFFHLGRRHGDLSSYDAWPPYKEVAVEDPGALAHAIAERAITWLALPDGWSYQRPEHLTHEQAMTLNALKYRLHGGFVYGPDAHVTSSDVEISSRDGVTEENLRFVLDPAQYVDSLRTDYPEFTYLIPLAEERIEEVDPATRQKVTTTRRVDGRADGGAERYRRLTPAEVVSAVPTPHPL